MENQKIQLEGHNVDLELQEVTNIGHKAERGHCSDIGKEVTDEMVSCLCRGGLGLMFRDFM